VVAARIADSAERGLPTSAGEGIERPDSQRGGVPVSGAGAATVTGPASESPNVKVEGVIKAPRNQQPHGEFHFRPIRARTVEDVHALIDSVAGHLRTSFARIRQTEDAVGRAAEALRKSEAALTRSRTCVIPEIAARHQNFAADPTS
jgi:hypothetical protein